MKLIENINVKEEFKEIEEELQNELLYKYYTRDNKEIKPAENSLAILQQVETLAKAREEVEIELISTVNELEDSYDQWQESQQYDQINIRTAKVRNLEHGVKMLERAIDTIEPEVYYDRWRNQSQQTNERLARKVAYEFVDEFFVNEAERRGLTDTVGKMIAHKHQRR